MMVVVSVSGSSACATPVRPDTRLALSRCGAHLVEQQGDRPTTICSKGESA